MPEPLEFCNICDEPVTGQMLVFWEEQNAKRGWCRFRCYSCTMEG